MVSRIHRKTQFINHGNLWQFKNRGDYGNESKAFSEGSRITESWDGNNIDGPQTINNRKQD